jgi:multiple sugar transport system substrate-binding protein
MVKLTGITWDHTRGYDSIVAATKAYMAVNPDVQISWDKRVLHDFGHAPVDGLARDYDMVILDHPWAGFIAADGCFVALDDVIDADTLASLAKRSAGPSHRTYSYDGKQWALAIDAATLVASYREDIMAELGATPPRTWEQVIALAEQCNAAGKQVLIPMGPIDAISSFLTLTANLSITPFADDKRMVHVDVARTVMTALKALMRHCDDACYEHTPVSVMEAMSTTDDVAYCPLMYGYNNYARAGYRPHRCRYADIPALGDDGPLGSHIGGAGLAISKRCAHLDVAADFAQYAAGGQCQRTIYFSAGGQPGHLDAWEDPAVDEAAGGFFSDTRETIERAYVRPTYNGYLPFQYEAGRLITLCLREDGDPVAMLRQIDRLYRASLKGTLHV